MKYIYTLLFICYFIPSGTCQYSKNIEDLSKKEVKEFLLQLNNPEIQTCMEQYHNRKVGGIFLTGIGSTLITVGLIEHNKPADPRNELAWYNGVTEIVLGSLTTLAGIIIWGQSKPKYEKARLLYIQRSPMETGASFIRDEQDYIDNQ